MMMEQQRRLIWTELMVTAILLLMLSMLGREQIKPASVVQMRVWLETGGCRFDPCQGRQHSFLGIDREMFSTVILSLPLIQEGQLSVSGERMRNTG